MKRPADEEPAQEPVPAAGEYQHTAEYPHPVEYAVAPGAAASTFVCPEEAGQVDHAQLWYYRDHSGQEQGPFSMMSMRAWFEAGYFEGGVTVAASYFGEVPFQYWQIAELWEVPQTQAFMPAEGVQQIVEAPVGDPEFIPSAEFAGESRLCAAPRRRSTDARSSWAGAQEGYVFQIGDFGVGYYKDNPPEVTVTEETLEQERMELKVKARRCMRMHPSVSSSDPAARAHLRRRRRFLGRTCLQTWGGQHDFGQPGRTSDESFCGEEVGAPLAPGVSRPARLPSSEPAEKTCVERVARACQTVCRAFHRTLSSAPSRAP